jgi:hypothetical protein
MECGKQDEILLRKGGQNYCSFRPPIFLFPGTSLVGTARQARPNMLIIVVTAGFTAQIFIVYAR